MNEELKKYLFDIQLAIEDIESFVGLKKSFLKFERDRMLQAAIERKIEIIGEAMSLILKLMPDISITNARRIVDTRIKSFMGTIISR